MHTVASWIKKILNRYTYTGKTRFICALGIFYAFFLTAEIFFFQHGLIQMFQMKKIGLKQHRTLSLILELSADLETKVLKTDPKSLKIDFDVGSLIREMTNHLYQVRKQNRKEDAFNNFNFYSDKHEDNFLFNKTLKLWEGVKTSIKTTKILPTQMITDFSQSIIDIMNHNMEIYSLKLGVEMYILLLSDMAVKKLPSNQQKVIEILSSLVLSEQHEQKKVITLFYQEKLIALQENLKKMKMQIDSALKQHHISGPNSDISLLVHAFNDYENMLVDYLKYLMKPSITFKQSFAYAKDVLEKGWRIEESLLDFLDANVQNALNVLYRRQRFSLAVLFIGLFAFLAMYMTRVIRRPLEDLNRASIALANGDLTVRVPVTSKDEVALIVKSLNEMAEIWQSSFLKAKKATLRVVDVSISISEIVKKLEDNAANQSEKVELIRNQAKEIGRTAQNFKGVLNEVNKSIVVTSHIAEIGRTNLEEMEAISYQMKETSRILVDTLGLISGQVDRINKELKDVVLIADQSNLLSLNTSIKASQTGIKGAGFAVVANKIRELADRIAFSTLDMEETVRQIVEAVDTASSDVKNFSTEILDQVEDESKLSEEFNIRIDQTQDQIQTFDKIQRNIDLQFEESLQIVALINNLVQVTQETEKSAHQLKQDAEFLGEGTRTLQKMIDGFKLS